MGGSLTFWWGTPHHSVGWGGELLTITTSYRASIIQYIAYQMRLKMSDILAMKQIVIIIISYHLGLITVLVINDN